MRGRTAENFYNSTRNVDFRLLLINIVWISSRSSLDKPQNHHALPDSAFAANSTGILSGEHSIYHKALWRPFWKFVYIPNNHLCAIFLGERLELHHALLPAHKHCYIHPCVYQLPRPRDVSAPCFKGQWSE